ncbi:MAG: hypothetical protein ACI35W_02910 [Anaeroplasmataceae bacterium]
MNRKMNNSLFHLKKNYRITNLIVSCFSYIIAVAVIILNRKSIKFYGLYIVLFVFIILLISFLFDFIIGKVIKRNLKKKEIAKSLKKDAIPESYNMYPINLRLKQMGLNEEQYDSLINFRITNILIWVIIGLVVLLLTTEFSSYYILMDIILPSIIKVGIIGIIAVIFDLTFEFFLKKFYRKRKNIKKEKKAKKINVFTKNKRIYYVPIVIIIAIIEVIIFVDFGRTDKLFTKIVIPLELINIINFIGIIVIDSIISYYSKIKSIITSNEDIFDKDYQLEDIKELEREEDSNEI